VAYPPDSLNMNFFGFYWN